MLNLDLEPGGRAPRPALRARPVVATGVHDRRQRRDQRRRPALPRVGRHLRARARGRRGACRRRARRLGGLAPDAPGYDLRGCFVGSEGTMGIATRVAVRLTPNPPAVGDDAVRVRLDRRRVVDGHRHDRGRRAAGRARDDGRADHPRRRRLRRRGLSRATPKRCCSWRSTVSTAASPSRSTRYARSRSARRGERARRGRRRGAGAAVEGPQVGVRRDRAHRARLLPPRRGRAAHAASSKCCGVSTRSPTRTS